MTELPSWFEEGKASWEARGWEVKPGELCSECQYGYIVRKNDWGWCCTNYGGCERAPG
jgi:hypothetical protein